MLDPQDPDIYRLFPRWDKRAHKLGTLLFSALHVRTYPDHILLHTHMENFPLELLYTYLVRICLLRRPLLRAIQT